MAHPNRCSPVDTRASIFLRLNGEGDQRDLAWVEFVGRYAPIIASFARKMGTKTADVEDVIQDVLAGFYKASPEFVYSASKGRFRSYLKTCTWRVLQRRFGETLHHADRHLTAVDPDELPVETAWMDIWEREKLQHALRIVRDRYLGRDERHKTFLAFELYVMLERPVADVASELGMSTDSVHAAKSRITAAIREVVRELEPDWG